MKNIAKLKKRYTITALIVVLAVCIISCFSYFFIRAEVASESKIVANASASFVLNGQTFNISSNNLAIDIKKLDTNSGSRSYTFHNGFNAYGTTTNFSSSLITSQGLSVIKYDAAANNWVTATSSQPFQIEAWKGYYVHNAGGSKTISLPYVEAFANQYKLTQGWNMLYSSNTKTRGDISIELNDNQVDLLGQWVRGGKILDNIFVIENESSGDACQYFGLLSDDSTPISCTNNPNDARSFTKSSKVLQGKAFWIYVN